MNVVHAGAEFKYREATCVSKSNMLGGFSRHMWLFEEGRMGGRQDFCNYRIPPPLPREPVTTRTAANRPGC